MKIDEPKTPYVTDEEFKKLCDEDPDYAKEFGDARGGEVDFNSQEAENDLLSDDDNCRMNGEFGNILNKNLERGGTLSDDEGKSSPGKSASN